MIIDSLKEMLSIYECIEISSFYICFGKTRGSWKRGVLEIESSSMWVNFVEYLMFCFDKWRIFGLYESMLFNIILLFDDWLLIGPYYSVVSYSFLKVVQPFKLLLVKSYDRFIFRFFFLWRYWLAFNDNLENSFLDRVFDSSF